MNTLPNTPIDLIDKGEEILLKPNIDLNKELKALIKQKEYYNSILDGTLFGVSPLQKKDAQMSIRLCDYDIDKIKKEGKIC